MQVKLYGRGLDVVHEKYFTLFLALTLTSHQ